MPFRFANFKPPLSTRVYKFNNNKFRIFHEISLTTFVRSRQKKFICTANCCEVFECVTMVSEVYASAMSLLCKQASNLAIVCSVCQEIVRDTAVPLRIWLKIYDILCSSHVLSPQLLLNVTGKPKYKLGRIGERLCNVRFI